MRVGEGQRREPARQAQQHEVPRDEATRLAFDRLDPHDRDVRDARADRLLAQLDQHPPTHLHPIDREVTIDELLTELQNRPGARVLGMGGRDIDRGAGDRDAGDRQARGERERGGATRHGEVQANADAISATIASAAAAGSSAW